MKKIISLILTLAMLLGIVVTTVSAATDLSFIDVKADAWYYDEVKTAYEEGIMQGKTSDIFDPEAQTTRAEFVKVLCAMSGDDYLGKSADLAFTDVEASEWYVDYIGWGVEHDIVKGLPGNKFGPDQPVTRQEMAVFIDRFVKYLDKELPNNPQIDSFKDADEVASWARESVELMRVSGIITGVGNGYFKPQDNASRAEIATVITRLLPVIKGGRVENGTSEEAPMAYTVYLPENYDESNKYPLLVYLSKENSNDVNILFESLDSPAHNSIVLVPQLPDNAWSDSKSVALSSLLDYINSEYSTDTECQYAIGVGTAGYPTWRFMVKYPRKISAVIFVQAATVRFWTTDDGKDVFEEDIDEQMKDMPIYIVHDTTNEDKMYRDYGKWVYEALTAEGYTDVFLRETTGYGNDIVNNFVSETDITLLEWLFEQQRATK